MKTTGNHQTINVTLVFLTPQILVKIQWGHPKRWRQMQMGWEKLGISYQYLAARQKKV